MRYPEQLEFRYKVSQVFRPGTPIDRLSLMSGRRDQIEEVFRAINQVGQHVVIFGERGVGKTSLSRVLSEFFTNMGIDIISPQNINCDGTDDFARVWAKVFRELFRLLKVRNKEASRQIDVDEENVYFETPDDVRFLLGEIPQQKIIILDEVDRLIGEETTTLLSDTIKTLSDHGANTTIVMIGVADSIDGLIAEHQSIERALVQVHIPRMSREELTEIITTGMAVSGIDFDVDAINHIVGLSAGLPHYTHTLALHAAEWAIKQDRSKVTNDDVNFAITETISKPGSLLSTYEKATGSSRRTLFNEVLLACALASKSGLGFFTSGSIREPLELITGKKYNIPSFSRHLDAFCSENRGCILRKTGLPRQYRFRFVNPLLQPFVIMHGISKEYIGPENIDSVFWY